MTTRKLSCLSLATLAAFFLTSGAPHAAPVNGAFGKPYGGGGAQGAQTETDPTAVKSVNGKGPGAITLSAGDVGAVTQAQAAAAAPVQSVNNGTGAVLVTPASIGAVPTTAYNAAGGVPQLDGNGKLQSAQAYLITVAGLSPTGGDIPKAALKTAIAILTADIGDATASGKAVLTGTPAQGRAALGSGAFGDALFLIATSAAAKSLLAIAESDVSVTARAGLTETTQAQSNANNVNLGAQSQRKGGQLTVRLPTGSAAGAIALGVVNSETNANVGYLTNSGGLMASVGTFTGAVSVADILTATGYLVAYAPSGAANTTPAFYVRAAGGGANVATINGNGLGVFNGGVQPSAASSVVNTFVSSATWAAAPRGDSTPGSFTTSALNVAYDQLNKRVLGTYNVTITNTGAAAGAAGNLVLPLPVTAGSVPIVLPIVTSNVAYPATPVGINGLACFISSGATTCTVMYQRGGGALSAVPTSDVAAGWNLSLALNYTSS